MTLLDRFRTQPRQSHPDPLVRLAYVTELPLDDHEAITVMARDDEDPRVRRTAVAKLMNPRTLSSIAASDRDEGVRSQAAAMLRDIALEAFEGIGETESLEAVEAINDPRSLAVVAKEATREIVALRAMSRLDDPHTIGSVARHAVLESARRGAFESLRARADHAEILAIAVNSDFRDTALAAVELMIERADLEQIAARGRNRSAVKRARAILRERDEQAALDAAEAVAVASAAAPVTPDAVIPVVPVASEFHPTQTAITEETGAGIGDSANWSGPAAAIGSDTRDESESLPVAEVDTKAAPEIDPRIRIILERNRARLAELVEEARAAAADADLSSARRRVSLIRREWKDLTSQGEPNPDLEAAFGEVEALVVSRETTAREAEMRVRREALARYHSLLGRVEPLAARSDISLKAADRALRDVRAALASISPLPTRQDAETITERLRAVHAVLAPKLQELREADDWKRFANVAIQEQLCSKMEALQSVEDPEAIAREVRHLQEQWRAAAEVPRAQADALWRRFKTAHDIVWPRCEAHFAALSAARAENLVKKIKLCEQAESLADSHRWIQTAEEIKRLQAEWKTIGAVSHGREKAVWERFRAACDRFFTRRHEDLVQRKAAWADNLGRKEALCVRAEALAESTEWDQAAAELKKLQAEWKTVGPVKKSKSDAIWLRFRGACDRFFTRYAQRHDTAKAERVAAREAICAELELLSAADAAEPSAGVLEAIRAIRARWQQEIGARGVDPERARALDARFSAAYEKVMTRWASVIAGSDLDPEANRKRMEALVRRIEELAASLSAPAASDASDEAISPTTRLATMLKEALAANTIGGKPHEDNRLAAAAEEVRKAQAAWSRVGVVSEEARRQLSDRFQRACRRITDRGVQLAAGARQPERGERSGPKRI